MTIHLGAGVLRGDFERIAAKYGRTIAQVREMKRDRTSGLIIRELCEENQRREKRSSWSAIGRMVNRNHSTLFSLMRMSPRSKRYKSFFHEGCRGTSMTDEEIARIEKLLGSGKFIREIVETTGITRYKVKKVSREFRRRESLSGASESKVVAPIKIRLFRDRPRDRGWVEW